jgi:hypothetical protein
MLSSAGELRRLFEQCGYEYRPERARKNIEYYVKPSVYSKPTVGLTRIRAPHGTRISHRQDQGGRGSLRRAQADLVIRRRGQRGIRERASCQRCRSVRIFG